MINAGMSNRHISDRSFSLFPGDRVTGLTPPLTVAFRHVPRATAWAILVLSLASCSASEGSHKSEGSSRSTTTATSASISPEEAATAAFNKFLTVTDQASEAPTVQDWAAAIRRVAADPAATASIQSVRDLAASGVRQSGTSQVALTIQSVQMNNPSGPTVSLSGCFDSASAHLVQDATGQVVPSGTPSHYVWAITVTQFSNEPGTPWLVRTLDPHVDESC